MLKLTMFFNAQNAGFSETFYNDGTEPVQLRTSLDNAFFQAATKFRHISVVLKAVRISRVDQAGKSILFQPYPLCQGTRFTEAEPGADVVSTAAVYRLTGQNGQARRLWCRGLADFDIVRDEFGNDTESAALRTMRVDYFTQLKRLNFQIRYQAKPPEALLTYNKVANVNFAGLSNPNRANIVLNPFNPLIVAGKRLVFSGVPSDLPNFPRTTQVLAVNTIIGVPNLEISYRLPGGLLVIPRKMQAWESVHLTTAINETAFERFGSHRTGRPFGSLRGRSRAAAPSL